ncbi:hypothetical protein BH23GEM6_BH23GEM6_10860 [soil metagenome]
MRNRLVLLCYAFAGCFPLAGGVGAQSHLPLATDVSVGFRTGHGGIYANREGATLDLVLGYSLKEVPGGRFIGGLALGVQGAIASDLSCLVLPDGGCAPDFPTFLSAGALLGVQRELWNGVAVRVLAGPAYYQPLDAAGAPGLLGSLDVTSPPWQQVSLMATLRKSLVSGLYGDALAITSLSLGFRFQ